MRPLDDTEFLISLSLTGNEIKTRILTNNWRLDGLFLLHLGLN